MNIVGESETKVSWSWIGIATDSPGRVRFKHGSYGWKLKDGFQTRTPRMIHDAVCFTSPVVLSVFDDMLDRLRPASVWFAGRRRLHFESFICAMQLKTTPTKKNHKTPGE